MGLSLQKLYLALNKVASVVRKDKIDRVVKATIGNHGEGTVHISAAALQAAMAKYNDAKGQQQAKEQVATAEAATVAANAKGGPSGICWPAAALYELLFSQDGKVSLG